MRTDLEMVHCRDCGIWLPSQEAIYSGIADDGDGPRDVYLCEACAPPVDDEASE